MQNSNYNHNSIEKEIYEYWEKNNFFKPKKNKKKHFSIVIPPPNVTGSLHMGHALNNSLQDLLVRFHRMNGYETLWQPGTDHAGIATQAIVEKKLIYKDTKLVNWDTKLETAISDLEVEQREVQSNLYYIKYDLVEENSHIIIATTRPETMLGDTAVAVNPADDRYKKFIGKKAKVPIANRNVKIVSDNYVSISRIQ